LKGIHQSLIVLNSTEPIIHRLVDFSLALR